MSNRIVFAERNLRVYAVDRRRRAKHKLFDVVVPGQFEQIQRAVDVGLAVKFGFRKRWSHTGTSGQVDDAVKVLSFENVFERGAVANI